MLHHMFEIFVNSHPMKKKIQRDPELYAALFEEFRAHFSGRPSEAEAGSGPASAVAADEAEGPLQQRIKTALVT